MQKTSQWCVSERCGSNRKRTVAKRRSPCCWHNHVGRRSRTYYASNIWHF